MLDRVVYICSASTQKAEEGGSQLEVRPDKEDLLQKQNKHSHECDYGGYYSVMKMEYLKYSQGDNLMNKFK